MDIDRRIKLAASDAITNTGLQNTAVDAAVYNAYADKWAAHFREHTGKYFQVKVDLEEVLTRFGSTDEDALEKYITEKLRLRDPNDYLN